MTEIEFGRGYRIVGILDSLTKELEGETVPHIQALVSTWRRRVLWGDGAGVLVLALLAGLSLNLAGTDAAGHALSWLGQDTPDWFWGLPIRLALALGGLVLVLGGWHAFVRSLVRRKMAEHLPERFGQMDLNLRGAFLRNTGMLRSLFRHRPVGWNNGTRKDIFIIREAIAHHVQVWNDVYTDPAGAKKDGRVPSPNLITGDQAVAAVNTAYRFDSAGYRQAQPLAPHEEGGASVVPGVGLVGGLLARLKAFAR